MAEVEVRVRAAAGGRVRLSVPWLVDGCEAVVHARVADLAGIRAVRVFPRTGHVVAWIESPCRADQLADALREAPHSAKPVRRATNERVLLGVAAFGAAALAKILLHSTPAGRAVMLLLHLGELVHTSRAVTAVSPVAPEPVRPST
ncbi:hypothetical protein [Saccharopolyspora taberi]|uniref:Uncharacterized protein n=1 Tax=Saccharopolyspora taberi TaxID=60895 RepID=A0ABN3VAW1_9PSEU